MDLSTNTLLSFLAQLSRDGCTFDMPQQQMLKQRLTLFNPEPLSGVKVNNVRCKAYPRPSEYSQGQQEAQPITDL